MTSDLVITGAREHNLKDISLTLPRDRFIVITGLSGSGKSLARLRHHLRRGPAPLRRDPLGLRAPVPRPDGQARRRQHRGPLAGHLHRPEDDLPQPAVHRRHRHRDLRLPAPALRPRRRTRTAPTAGGPSPGRACSRSSTSVCELDAGHALQRRRAGRARPQGRVRQAVRAAARRRLHPRRGRRRGARARGGHRPRQEVQARHRRRRRPAGDEGGPAAAPDRLRRDRRRPRRRPRRRRARRRRRAPSPSARSSPASTAASRCRRSSRASSPSTPRTAPARPATGWASPRRSTPTWSCPTGRLSIDQGALLPYGQLSFGWLEQVFESVAKTFGVDTSVPWDEMSEEDRDLFLYGTGKERIPLSYRNYQGRMRHYNSSFPGDRQAPAAALRRDRVGAGPPEDRGVHGGPAVPGVQGRTAQAHEPRRHRRRAATSTSSRCSACARRSGSSTSSRSATPSASSAVA